MFQEDDTNTVTRPMTTAQIDEMIAEVREKENPILTWLMTERELRVTLAVIEMLLIGLGIIMFSWAIHHG